jgi:hypothetical protein
MNIVDVLFPPELYPNIAKVTLRAVPHNSILFLEASQVKDYLKSCRGGTTFAHNSQNRKYTTHFIETAGRLVHV